MVPNDLYLLLFMPPPFECHLDLVTHFSQIEHSKSDTMSPQRLGYRNVVASLLGALSHSFTHLLWEKPTAILWAACPVLRPTCQGADVSGQQPARTCGSPTAMSVSLEADVLLFNLKMIVPWPAPWLQPCDRQGLSQKQLSHTQIPDL